MDDSQETCVYTIPATFGSSGSGIFDVNGKLVGILSAALIKFENLAIGPGPVAIDSFLRDTENKLDIHLR